jgi:MOSC domain-containing protein YiiM
VTTGRIVQLSISPGGVPKRAVPSAAIGPLGLAGDDHRNRRWHGGPDRAVCLYSTEQLARLAAEGHAVAPGALGENVTTEGVDLAALAVGDRLRLGDEVELEIASRVDPCKTIRGCFADGRAGRVSPKTHPAEARLYARVVRAGIARVGDAVVVLERP